MAPVAIRAAVEQEAPAAVRDAVQLVLKEVVENRTEPLRRMMTGQVRGAGPTSAAGG